MLNAEKIQSISFGFWFRQLHVLPTWLSCRAGMTSGMHKQSMYSGTSAEVFLNGLSAADFNLQLLAEIPVWLDGSSSPNDSTGMIYGLEMVIPYYVWASERFTLE